MRGVFIFLVLFGSETIKIDCKENVKCMYDNEGFLKHVTLELGPIKGSDIKNFKTYTKTQVKTCEINTVMILQRDPLITKLWIGDEGKDITERFRCGKREGKELNLDVDFKHHGETFLSYTLTCRSRGDGLTEESAIVRKNEDMKKMIMLTVVDENGRTLHDSPAVGQLVRLRAIKDESSRHSHIRYVSCDARPYLQNSLALELIDENGCPAPGSLIDGGFVDEEDKTYATSGLFRMFTLQGYSTITFRCRMQISKSLQGKNHCHKSRIRLKREANKTQDATASVKVSDPELERAQTIIEAAKLQSTQVCLQNKTILSAVIIPTVVAVLAAILSVIFSCLALRYHRQALRHKEEVETLRKDSFENTPAAVSNGKISNGRSRPPSYASEWKGSNRF